MSAAHAKPTAKVHKEEEHTAPWIAALTTYFGYAVLIIFGEHDLLPCLPPSKVLPRPQLTTSTSG